MAITVPTKEVLFLEIAHVVERALTSQALSDLWDAFYCPETNARRIKQGLFVEVIRGVVAPLALTGDVLVDKCTAPNLGDWFTSMDSQGTGWVHWSEFEVQLSLASTMRKYATEYRRPSKIAADAISFLGPTRVLWIAEWRRCVLVHNSKFARVCCPDATADVPLHRHQSCVIGASYLPPLGTLLTFGCDRLVVAWDHKKATPLREVEVAVPASAACFESVRKRVWIALHDGFLHAFDATMEHRVAKSLDKHNDWVQEMLFLEELGMIVTASLDKTLAMWDTEGHKVCTKVGHTRGVSRVVYMRQARCLFSCGQGREIIAWNPFSLESTPTQILHGHDREITSLMPDVCNRSLISADMGSRIIVWDTQRFVKTQVLELAPMLLDTYPIVQVVQNPTTRELHCFSATHVYHLQSTLASYRLPKLGHRVRFLAACMEARVLAVAFQQALHLFDMLDGTLLRSIERPFGAGGHVLFVASLEVSLQLLVQSEGAAFTFQLTDKRPLPAAAMAPFPARGAHITGAAWIALASWVFPVAHRELHKVAVVQADGVCWAQSYALENDASASTHVWTPVARPPVQAASVSGTVGAVKKPSAQQPSDPVEGDAIAVAAVDGTMHLAVCVTKKHELYVWDLDTAIGSDGSAAATSGTARLQAVPRLRRIETHSVGSAVSSRVIGVQFFSSRNAVLLLRPDGLSLLQCRHDWTPLLDWVYDEFPDLSSVGSTDKVLQNAVGQLPADASGFSCTRVIPMTHETVCVVTDFLGRVLIVDLVPLFAAFFGQQTARIAAESETPSRDIPSVASSLSAPPDPSPASPFVKQLGPHITVTCADRFSSSTASIHLGVDSRNRQPVVIKFHHDLVRYQRELHVRRRCVGTELGMWVVGTLAMAAEKRMAPADESNDLRLRTPVDMESALALQRSPSSETIEPIVIECGEGCLADLIPKHGEPATNLQALTQYEKDVILMSLLTAVAALHAEGFVSMDLRPRVFHKIGDVYKLASLDSVVPANHSFVDSISVSYCPPELCAVMAQRCGAPLTEMETTDVSAAPETRLQTGAQDDTTSKPSSASANASTLHHFQRLAACHPSMNLWMLAVVAYEVQQGEKLFPAKPTATQQQQQVGSVSYSSVLKTVTSASTVFAYAGAAGRGPPTSVHVAAYSSGALVAFDTLRCIPASVMEAIRTAVPEHTVAGYIVRSCLHLKPEDRTPAAQVLEALRCAKSENSFQVPTFESLFVRPSCFRSGAQNVIPSKLAPTMVPVQLTSSQMGRSASGHRPCEAVQLARCSIIAHAAALPGTGSFVCCDRDPSKSNEGVMHLYDAAAVYRGSLPPQEYGEDNANIWRWPSAADLAQRSDALKSVATEDAATSDASRPEEAVEADDAADAGQSGRRSATSPISQRGASPKRTGISLQPVRGWQSMSTAELAEALKQSCSLNPSVSIAETVEHFVETTVRRAPFFRGGQRDGDSMPLYAPEYLTVGGSRSAVKTSNSTASRDSSYTRRKWARHWQAVHKMLCDEDSDAPKHATMDLSFLMKVPPLQSSSDGDVTDALERFFCMEDVMAAMRPDVDSGVMEALRGERLTETDHDARRRHRWKLQQAQAYQESFLHTDNNLSAMPHKDRRSMQALLKSPNGPREMEALRSLLNDAHERSLRHQAAAEEKKRGARRQA